MPKMQAFPLCEALRQQVPYSYKKEGGLPAMKASSGLANLAIEGVLELSADAHIQRKMSARGSSDFHRLTGAIAAYGNALAVLVALQERDELSAMIAELELPGSVTEVAH